jgi:hypothetical protein
MSTTKSTASVRPAAPADSDTSKVAAASARGGSESGTAIVGTLVGFLIFMILLLFAVQLLVRLYATSTLTAAAASAAEQVADSPDPQATAPQAAAAARQQLGTFGATSTSFVWKEIDGEQVVLEVHGESPSFLPLPAAWRSISRTVTVRTERFR